MIAQSKDNPKLKVRVISARKTSFTGKVLNDASGWKKDEVSTAFATSSFHIITEMIDYLEIKERLTEINQAFDYR